MQCKELGAVASPLRAKVKQRANRVLQRPGNVPIDDGAPIGREGKVFDEKR